MGIVKPLGFALLSVSIGIQAGCQWADRARDRSVPIPPLPVRPADTPEISRPVESPTAEAPTASEPIKPQPSDPPKATRPVKPSPEVTPAAAVQKPLSAQQLYARAVARHGAMDSWVARLQRRERPGSRWTPLEVMEFKFRLEPLSVHFRWIGDEGAGRQVLWVEGQHEGKIQVLTAAGDIPLMPAGKHIPISPDSVLARAQSPHHIKQAGFTGTLEIMGRVLARQRANPGQKLVRTLGLVKRPEYPYPLEGLELVRQPKSEKILPRGGKQQLFFDPDEESPSFGLPVVILTLDEKGEEVQYHCFDRFLFPIRLDDADFDPDVLWKD